MEEMRLDKWLWAARFFKTRPLAQKAIEGGKVHAEGIRVKPGKHIQIGHRLEIRAGTDLYEIEVVALSERRGPAPAAQALYVEGEDSRKRRDKAALERKAAAASTPNFGGRPDKRQRRQLRDFKRGNA